MCHVPDKKFIANFFFKKVLFIVISLNCSCSFHFKDLFWFWMNGLYFWKGFSNHWSKLVLMLIVLNHWNIKDTFFDKQLLQYFYVREHIHSLSLLWRNKVEWWMNSFSFSKEALAKIRLIKRNGTWESDKHLKACQKISTWMLTLVKSNDKKIIVTFSYKISLLLFNTARYATKDFMKY